MKKHIIQIRLEVESNEAVEQLGKFYNELIKDSEGIRIKTTYVEVVVDGAFTKWESL